jgi:hypothetical protein
VNTSELLTPQPEYDLSVLPRPTLIVVDLSSPTIVRLPSMPRTSRALNHGWLLVSESLAERIKLRFDVEVCGKWRGTKVYKRLRSNSLLVSAPNAEQAELFIQAMHDFAASLNGKWLAPKPEPTSGADQQPISTQSGADPQR